ncbi:hypothetical protein M413DRAFT_77426 [Hebeloma cylindrosporum]|uniref:Aminoglycoside phosphotransferase domain-containing protein n=1 Tax=Hebeloma cylindrosporum TaxID=76867 RepID=A0A0C3C0N5_HEBCY|nr:hypothetical protein M413DRAFT_77426 [Hebeloma cylindrosporum h7]
MLGSLNATSLVILRRYGCRGISSYASTARSQEDSLMVPTLKKWLYGSGIRSFNRIFALQFDGAREDLIARIPFPSAGPRGLLTKSEVATMDFVRRKLGVPIPKVLAWDPSPSNFVGTEFIITEKCPGMSLAEKLPDTSTASLYSANVAMWMGGLANIRFSQFGSIYYKEDVDESLQARPLYAEGGEEDDCSERFRIGPSVERAFYRLERADMEFDRGPWPDAYSYLKASAECEIQWMKTYANSEEAVRTQRHIGPMHNVARHVSVLKQWISMIPAFIPSSDKLARPALSHPGILSKLVFIDDSDLWDTSGLIGWQGASIQPLFLTGRPEFVRHEASKFKFIKSPGILPANFSQLTPAAQAQALEEQTQSSPFRSFLVMVRSLSPELFDAWVQHQKHAQTLKTLSVSASHVWSQGLPLFEHLLMNTIDEYGKSIPKHPDYPELPVTFSSEEKKRTAKGLQEIATEHKLFGDIKNALHKKGIEMDVDGSVRAEDYTAAREEAKAMRRSILGRLAQKERIMLKAAWPLRDTKFAYNQESCIGK